MHPSIIPKAVNVYCQAHEVQCSLFKEFVEAHPNEAALGMQHPSEEICIPVKLGYWDAASQEL